MADALRQRYGPRLRHLFILPEDPEHPDAVDYVFTFVAVVDERKAHEETELVLNPGDTEETDLPALVHVVTVREFEQGTTDAARVAKEGGTRI